MAGQNVNIKYLLKISFSQHVCIIKPANELKKCKYKFPKIASIIMCLHLGVQTGYTNNTLKDGTRSLGIYLTTFI
jgi:hypothetical protein